MALNWISQLWREKNELQEFPFELYGKRCVNCKERFGDHFWNGESDSERTDLTCVSKRSGKKNIGIFEDDSFDSTIQRMRNKGGN